MNLIFRCLIISVFIMFFACQEKGSGTAEEPTLKNIFARAFKIGAALNASQISGKDTASLELALKQFNSITAENILKWEKIHPQLNTYDFALPDSFVELGQKNNMFIIGHTLVWHYQTPDWVFEDDQGNPLGRDALLARLKEHIHTVVGRYKGKIQGWDVVNEAVNDDGSMRKSKWFEIIGDDYIEKAFTWAHEADPEAELYYNDYNMWHKGKVETVAKMVDDLKSKGVPIHGIGLQGHWGLDYPPMDELENALQIYAASGLKVMVTELDIRTLPRPGPDTGADISMNFELQNKLNPFSDGFPDSMQVKLSNSYVEFFKLFIKYQNDISRVTFWGVHDGVSWCNDWPVRGRKDYPLLFNREFKPKPAFYKLVNLME